MYAVCKICNEDKNILKDKTCRTCLNKERTDGTLNICMICGEVEVFLDGYCEECYRGRHKIKESAVKGYCLVCGEERIIKSREMCSTCYDRLYRPVKRCVKCEELKAIHGKKMCITCYMQ